MNATACERVAQFALYSGLRYYTSENFNYLCAQHQNSKTINRMEKIKLSLNFVNNMLWITKKKKQHRKDNKRDTGK